MHTELPQPPEAALAHSARLVELLQARIADNRGWISFRDYMQATLYEPGLGYYSAGATKFGAAGDFVTAPEISPLFSRCLAGQCAEVLRQLEGGVILELGAGSGRMAADLLMALDADILPDHYLILEPSADLRERQAATLARLPDELRSRVAWLDALPVEPLRGVIVANEVVDALAVQRFVVAGDGIDELGVASDGRALVMRSQPASATLAETARALCPQVADGYTSEFCAALAPWLASLAALLDTGAMLLFDYGYNRREYYMPERSTGTLRCYYRHRAHDDALLWPGLQDITAWVDFTAVADAAVAAGLDVAGYTTQAQFLLAGGIDVLAEQAFAADSQRQVELAHGLRRLMLPGEMGDTIKVMALTRNASAPSAFTGRDMRGSL